MKRRRASGGASLRPSQTQRTSHGGRPAGKGNHPIDLVVIGASAGGVQALISVIQHLPADLAATVLIVMHIGEASQLPAILNRCGTLPCSFVSDHPKMEMGHVYIAPPHFHIRVEDGTVGISQGPKENLRRPAIDPLFRSAARLYRERVAGVILTGALDDGAAGLFAVKSRGGITIVQDPDDAVHPSMPTQALRRTHVDYCLPVAQIGQLLVKLVGRRKMNSSPLIQPPEPAPGESENPHGGKPLPVSCPECQGPLFMLDEGKKKYIHCRIGHAFTSESLNEAHDEALERALWTVVRTLGEKVILARTTEQNSRKSDPEAARRLREKAEETQHEIELLKQILEKF